MEVPRPPKSFFFKGQLLHFPLLTGLLIASIWLANVAKLGATTAWFIASIAVPITHQVFVWLAWRSELCFSAVTKSRFPIYGTVFMVLLVSRPLVVLGLAISDQGSLELPVAVRIVVPILMAIPAIYTLYSVARYFGFARAMGIDHFDPDYRNAPLVKEGIFKWASNSMYVFGFFNFWVIAIAFSSRAACMISSGPK